MARYLALALVVVGLGLACNDGPLALRAEVYPLRAVLAGPGTVLPVPASVPSASETDTLRYLGGEFELMTDGTWRERWDRAFISGGVERNRQTFESAGRYRVVESERGRWVLDLYPGQRIPDNLAPIAVLRGDTLYHSAFIYAR